MDRRTIGLIWAAGAVLMLVIYMVGTQHFLAVAEQAIANAAQWLSVLVDTLVQRAFDLVRAASIALYAVFVVLAVLSMSRGVRAGGMLFVVSVVFLVLVRTDWYEPGTKWMAACMLAAVAALVQTQRLLRTPRRRNPADPWGMAPRGGKRADPT